MIQIINQSPSPIQTIIQLKIIQSQVLANQLWHIEQMDQ